MLPSLNSISSRSDLTHNKIALDPTHRPPPPERLDPKHLPDFERSDRPDSIRTIGSALSKDRDIRDPTAFDPPVAPFDPVSSTEPIPDVTGLDVISPAVPPTRLSSPSVPLRFQASRLHPSKEYAGEKSLAEFD